MNITNKTARPISVPLDGGKKLFLGPGKTGQITPKSAEHPPLVKLIEAGDLEIDDKGRNENVSSSGSPASQPGSQTSFPTTNIRKTGDR